MKFVINRDLFSKALGRIQGVLSRRASLPVLSNVRLEVNSDGKLRIGATDLDVTYDGELPCRSGQVGTVTVDGKRLYEVVKSLPGEEVDIDVNDESKISIRCKNAEFMLLGTPSDTYPTLPDAHGVKLFPVDGLILRELLERSMLSISTDESRPNLNGVYFRCLDNNRICMVSTDGHRLSQGERDVSRDSEIPGHDGVIIPRKGILELKRMLDEAGREVAFGFLDNNLVVSAANTSLFVRLIDASFPDYKQVIPKSSERIVVLDRVPFLDSLKRIGLLASERTHGVRVELTSGMMTLLSDNPEFGKAREEIVVEYDGGDLIIAFNAKYVTEILSTLNAAKVEMALNEALSPGLFREHENDDYLFVVMPMRL
jgi:DNA polymerase-3 subunit beta